MECGKGLNHLISLKQNEKHVHSTERKLVCKEFGENFVNRDFVTRKPSGGMSKGKKKNALLLDLKDK